MGQNPGTETLPYVIVGEWMFLMFIPQNMKILGSLTNPHVDLSENSVPLHPMVLLIIIPMKNGYFIGNINPTFSDKPMSQS